MMGGIKNAFRNKELFKNSFLA